MKIIININVKLLVQAQEVTGITKKETLIKEGLRALIERESARRLARLGGTEPQLQDIPRRQMKSA